MEPLVRHAVRLNGVTRLALTKLDVLSGLSRAAGLRCRYRQGVDPDSVPRLRSIDAVPESMRSLPGWERRHHRLPVDFGELPAACRAYVHPPSLSAS